MAATKHGAGSGDGAYQWIRAVDRRARRRVAATSRSYGHSESII